jgi:hypothetical protein
MQYQSYWVPVRNCAFCVEFVGYKSPLKASSEAKNLIVKNMFFIGPLEKPSDFWKNRTIPSNNL